MSTPTSLRSYCLNALKWNEGNTYFYITVLGNMKFNRILCTMYTKYAQYATRKMFPREYTNQMQPPLRQVQPRWNSGNSTALVLESWQYHPFQLVIWTKVNQPPVMLIWVRTWKIQQYSQIWDMRIHRTNVHLHRLFEEGFPLEPNATVDLCIQATLTWRQLKC